MNEYLRELKKDKHTSEKRKDFEILKSYIDKNS